MTHSPVSFPINVLTPRYETMKLREWFISGTRLLPHADSYYFHVFNHVLLGEREHRNILLMICRTTQSTGVSLTNTEACPLPEAAKPVSQVLDIKIYLRNYDILFIHSSDFIIISNKTFFSTSLEV